jgi:hypothetical protein
MGIFSFAAPRALLILSSSFSETLMPKVMLSIADF